MDSKEFEQFIQKAAELIEKFPEECKGLNARRLATKINNYFFETYLVPNPTKPVYPKIAAMIEEEHKPATILYNVLRGSQDISPEHISSALKSLKNYDTTRENIIQEIMKIENEMFGEREWKKATNVKHVKVKPTTPMEEIKSKYEGISVAQEHIDGVRARLQSNSLDDGNWFNLLKGYTKHDRDFIERSKEEIEKDYKKVNPELAALREEERNKVKEGMDPEQAQKERREAVKAYYNKKQSKESR